jgi:hypothetical protein
LDGTLGMPTFEDSIDHQTSEKGDSGKMWQQWMQARNKMQVPKETSRYHQAKSSLRVVAP